MFYYGLLSHLRLRQFRPVHLLSICADTESGNGESGDVVAAAAAAAAGALRIFAAIITCLGNEDETICKHYYNLYSRL